MDHCLNSILRFVGISIVEVAAFMTIAANSATAQFSPGELSKAHRAMEGSANCTQCHEVGREISGAKCLGCHEEIKSQFDLRRGFHFAASAEKCIVCHKEHLGIDAKTTLFDEKTFDHSRTGFVLTGKHLAISCGECHASGKIKNGLVQSKLGSYPHQTFLGLTSGCASCHEDPHRKQFNQDCATCHSTTAWSPVQSFDHSKTKYALEGMHRQAACNGCHPSFNKRTGSADFRTAGFSDCTPCHATPHRAKFTGRDCQSCHSPAGWKAAMEKPFDHRWTRYELIGKHSTLECIQCHRTGAFAKAFLLSFNRCIDCHADKHEGEFREKYDNNCAACHTEFGYTPSTFTLARHDDSRFKLTGAHLATVCSSCHTGSGSNRTNFHFTRMNCESCHQDVHKGQFAVEMKGSSCDKCHTTEQWKRSTFDHSKTIFSLEGMHVSARCADCHHQNALTASGVLQFEKISAECQTCHKDVHAAQFAQDGRTGCGSCHSSQSWGSLRFDHEKQSSFSLKGAHKKVACDGCHKTEKAGGAALVRYRPLTSKCETCHDREAGK